MTRTIPFFSSEPVDDRLAEHLDAMRFTGAVGQVAFVPHTDEPTLLAGVGPRAALTANTLRIAFAEAGRALGHLPAVTVDLDAVDAGVLPAAERDKAAAEGLVLGSYTFQKYRTTTPLPPSTEWRSAAPSAGWDAGIVVGRAVSQLRDLVNEPANFLTPSVLADHIAGLATDSGVTANVFDEDWLMQNGAGGIIAIGRGSVERPRLVELVHEGAGGEVALCLVGKGVTYDSGGLSLKSPDQLIMMNYDMAGAATIAQAMSLLKTVAPHLHVRAYLPLVENMPGPHSTRPGDVVTARNGKTIELLDTDFEGRVILADALSLACEQKPALLVDLATLTYGASIALGPRIAALFGTDDAVTLVENASASSGEGVWRLPMQDWMQPTISSRLADVKNFPYMPQARAITAAMFLREFVDSTVPWAHLDIAGPAKAHETQELSGEGATGFGLRLLLDLFENLAAADA